MWLIFLYLGIVILLIGIITCIVQIVCNDDCFGGLVICVIACILIGINGYFGIKQHNAIPRQEYAVKLVNQNIHHYRQSMRAGRNDEKSEHHNNPKFTGDLGEPKDNAVWNKNYQQYHANEFAKYNLNLLIKYEKHPLRCAGYYFYLHKDSVYASINLAEAKNFIE